MINVVIPAHDAEATIERCVESVLASPLVRRVVVVLDACTDGTGKVIEQIRARDQRVCLCVVDYKSASRARNCGLSLAEPGWVALLDADDFWLNDVAEEYRRYLEKGHAPAILAACQTILPSGKSPLADEAIGLVSLDAYVESGLPLLTSSTVCVDTLRLPIRDLFPEGQRLGEDLVAWCRLLSRSTCAMVWGAHVGIDRGRLGASWSELNAAEFTKLHRTLRDEIGEHRASILVDRRLGSLLALGLTTRRWDDVAEFVRGAEIGALRAATALARHAGRRIAKRLR